MVKHVILWTLNPVLSDDEKNRVKHEIKESLEALADVVSGIVELKVIIDGLLATSNCDLMLDSTFESAEALNIYASHPAHVAAATTKVKPFTVQRVCIDYAL